ncbi:MAG: hypothetical protein IPM54_25100 [Polyangiaceae bacterium]|nr:hypothetical protein [Polyangiaceae bacterium]
MTTVLACALSFAAGVIVGGAGMWAVWSGPMSRITALETRLDELLRNRNPN